MNKLSRLLCLLLSLILLASAPLTALAEEAEAEDAEVVTAEEQEEVEFPDELIVGHPTITKGDFFTELFGNDTADIDVRALIHGYNLVNWDQNQGVYVMDPSVVTDYQVTIDDVGNKTYRMILADDLYYSDGTPITAWDYAFSILLMMSPEVEAIGGKIYRAEHILGYDEYITTRKKILNGEELTDEDVFSLGGVEVHDDHQLWITLDHDFLPYFFETGLLMTVPYPIHVIAPGCKVYDDGFGIYLGNEDPHSDESLFTPELLQKTILDPETGYNSHPSVVSGPYTMVSWDEATGEGHYEINPYFKGAWFHNSLPGPDYSGPVQYIQVLDEEGNPKKTSSGEEIWLVKPTIEKIEFVVADNDTLIQKLADGELHLVNKVTNGKTISEGLQSDAAKEAGIRNTQYPRIGLSFLTFTYDWPTVHDMKVRQAIAWCMDRDLLTDEYCGYTRTIDEENSTRISYGTRVDGYFGIEQWEYLLVTGALDYPVNFLDAVYPSVDLIEDEDEKAAMEEERNKAIAFKNRFAKDEEEYEMYLAAWEALTKEWEDALVKYGVYDLENDPERTNKIGLAKANKLLDEAGWTLTADGGDYAPGGIRAKKMEDDSIVALDLKMMYPEGNDMAAYFMGLDPVEYKEMLKNGETPVAAEDSFVDNLRQVGIALTLVPEPMEGLLKSYYRQTERTTDMIYLATNFHVIVDPSITYSTDKTKNHEIWNNTYSDDEELWYDAKAMRETEPGDIFEYVSEWVTFQKRYNEVLPTIPIYSNIYFDFYNQYLQNYYITGQVTWSQAILPAYFALENLDVASRLDMEEEEEGEGMESLDD